MQKTRRVNITRRFFAFMGKLWVQKIDLEKPLYDLVKYS